MKPITIFFEISGPCQLRPGFFSRPFKGLIRFRRAWWLWFAVAWVRMDHHEYNRWIESRNTEWRLR